MEAKNIQNIFCKNDCFVTDVMWEVEIGIWYSKFFEIDIAKNFIEIYRLMKIFTFFSNIYVHN